MNQPVLPGMNDGTLPAITLHQPWATLIAEGIKTVETRSWFPPVKLLGRRIAIHAGATKLSLYSQLGETDEAMFKLAGAHWRDEVPYKAIVATATLSIAGVVRRHEHRNPQEDHEYGDLAIIETISFDNGKTRPKTMLPVPMDAHGDFGKGRVLWILKDIRKVTPPYPINGQRGIWYWDYPPELPGYHTEME